MRLIALIALLCAIPHSLLAAEYLTRVRLQFVLVLMISILLMKWPIFAVHAVGH